MADSPGSFVSEPDPYLYDNELLENTSKYAEGAMDMSFYKVYHMRGKTALAFAHWESQGLPDETGAKAPEAVTDIVVEGISYSAIS